MRPLLKPALRRVWRDGTTVQIGLDPDRAVVLSGLGPPAARFLDALDGSRDDVEAVGLAPAFGLDEEAARQVLDALRHAGLLDDAASEARLDLDPAERDRLAPDLASLSLVHRIHDGGVATLARRRRAAVRVHGAGRIGVSVATLLAAAGVGAVAVVDAAPASVSDAAPAGLRATDAGMGRDAAAAARVRAAAPSTDTRARRPDLVVLALSTSGEARLGASLRDRGVPHLVATVRETRGIVGPLVLPGRSSCLRCHDLHRRDRDPAWPRVAAQLASPGRGGAEACDVVLATAVAAHTALQALAHLDGAPTVPAVDGTLEIALPDGRIRRRSWAPHPECGCAR